ncbi:oxygenase MpaB family protein [Hansschlegelia quercus]|uniref:DUF2236 domain-containing protein n=1 Tax=Hansschlegelia quercus TaxID=2528245 RepID=A0A4Q9GHW6_9HYPH|nr:oxygenase MpaB family protein [Hansschlegelia quercus]TBN53662.1 DUF2236 domain-containing protein [Hansschlegelia quercus]
MVSLRSVIKTRALAMVGADRPANGPPPPRQDDGLFGPRSAAWRVHGDLATMMIGGVGALLLQMLHPAALAGVWDHSDFRHDMAARLRRTAQFVGGVTYGSVERATGLIARVRTIHDGVTGELPDGAPYSANDPKLLAFVHVAEGLCFLDAFRRYRDPLMSRAEQDRYFRETAVVARMLGSDPAPETRADAVAFLEAIRPELRVDHRTREVARTLLSQKPDSPALAPLFGVMFDAGADLMPDWAVRMHGFHYPPARKTAIRASALGVVGVMRWVMRDN